MALKGPKNIKKWLRKLQICVIFPQKLGRKSRCIPVVSKPFCFGAFEIVTHTCPSALEPDEPLALSKKGSAGERLR